MEGMKDETRTEPSVDDAELLLLDKIFSDIDTKNELPKVPRLVEDKSFMDAFSYELDTNELKKAAVAAPTVTEELDSSDDEGVRNFLERKYNEYGSDINKKLKLERSNQQEAKVEREVNSSLRTAKLETAATSKSRDSNQHARSSVKTPIAHASSSITPQLTIYTDPIFGLRIINPLVSSIALVERMSGRKSVSFAEISFHIQRGDLSKDWVIAGVVVNKSPVRQTKTGQSFSIWRLSDLRGEMKMISLFLFKSAHKDLWKTAQGMCIAILNPSVFEKRAESGDIACLSIDTAHKVLILGQSKDIGVCKAKKKDGSACTSIVNLSECDYCIYHMKSEYNKMSKRSELQSATAGRGLNDLRNKVLGKSEVFYGGQSFTAIPAKKSAKLVSKDRERISALAEHSFPTFASTVNRTKEEKRPVQYASRYGPVSRIANNIESSSIQRQKDVERLKILQNLKCKDDQLLKEHHTETETAASMAPNPSSSTHSFVVPEKFQNREFSNSVKTLKSFSENITIELNVGKRQAEWGKLKAAEIVKKFPIQKTNPNSLRGSQQGKRRAIDDLNEKSEIVKRQKLDEELRENERKSRIQRIIDATSSHRNLIDMREQHEQDQYFNKLAKKEALEEKMLNTYKVPCKAVICLQCKYTAFSAAERCKQEKHQLKIVDAEKRFFQCKDCGNRTVSVFRYPKVSCKNCSGSRWERTAIIREKKTITQELSVRGNEETFLGSLAGTANLNLLVPDE